MLKTLLCILALACLAALPAAGQEDVAATPAARAGRVAGPGLAPGDAVKVMIWREPDLSGTYRVAEDGTLTLPLLGPRQVTGVSVEELRDRLVGDYSAQLKNPSIEVSILRRVSVIGEINQAGLYDIEPAMRMGDVLAMAGGVTAEGSDDKIDIVRDGQEMADDVDITTVIGDRVRSGDQIVVGKRSWFARNPHVVIGFSATVVGLVLRGALD